MGIFRQEPARVITPPKGETVAVGKGSKNGVVTKVTASKTLKK